MAQPPTAPRAEWPGGEEVWVGVGALPGLPVIELHHPLEGGGVLGQNLRMARVGGQPLHIRILLRRTEPAITPRQPAGRLVGDGGGVERGFGRTLHR